MADVIFDEGSDTPTEKEKCSSNGCFITFPLGYRSPEAEDLLVEERRTDEDRVFWHTIK